MTLKKKTKYHCFSCGNLDDIDSGAPVWPGRDGGWKEGDGFLSSYQYRCSFCGAILIKHYARQRASKLDQDQ